MTGTHIALALLCVAGTTACDRAMGAPESEPLRERFKRADIVRYHMRLHIDDLLSVERRLVNGKLEEAKSLAFLIGRPEKDPGLTLWADQTRTLTDAAKALSRAKSIDEALRLEVRVAVACASCHEQAVQRPIFPDPGRAPRRDHATSTVRMVSHQWAVDRLWEGLVANSDTHWRAGLAVLSATPLPYAPTTDAALLGEALQHRANEALRSPTGNIDERARIYGEMLVTCAACHSSLKRRK
jgi:cytochrome c553